MNLVEQIKNQLTEGVLGHLSSLIGASEGETRSAVGAAVPAVLAALSNLVSSGSGAQKLASALGHFETGSVGHAGRMLSEQPAAVLEQGNGILNSLFSSGAVSGIVGALSRFAGIGSGSGQKLLGYLMPLVLGAIAGRFTGKGVNPQGLAGLFADEKANIAKALPSGFSLADVPGAASTREAARMVEEAVRPAADTVWRWLIPVVAVIALGALLLWYFFGRTPSPTTPITSAISSSKDTTAISPSKVGDFAQVSTDLTGTFKSLTESLTSIKDAASAEAALPKLRDISDRLDEAKSALGGLTESGRSTILAQAKLALGKLKELTDKVLAMGGVGDKVRPAVEAIMDKLNALVA